MGMKYFCKMSLKSKVTIAPLAFCHYYKIDHIMPGKVESQFEEISANYTNWCLFLNTSMCHDSQHNKVTIEEDL